MKETHSLSSLVTALPDGVVVNDAARLALTARIKNALDPFGLLNPGALFAG